MPSAAKRAVPDEPALIGSLPFDPIRAVSSPAETQEILRNPDYVSAMVSLIQRWEMGPSPKRGSQAAKYRAAVRRLHDELIVHAGLKAQAVARREMARREDAQRALQVTPKESYEAGSQPEDLRALPRETPEKFKRAKRSATKPNVPESREGTTLLGVHLKNDLAADFKLIATLQRTTAAKILGAFVAQYVEMHKSPQQVETALRGHVEDLSGNRDTPIARALRALANPKR